MREHRSGTSDLEVNAYFVKSPFITKGYFTRLTDDRESNEPIEGNSQILDLQARI